jgi:hypothetical protein
MKQQLLKKNSTYFKHIGRLAELEPREEQLLSVHIIGLVVQLLDHGADQLVDVGLVGRVVRVDVLPHFLFDPAGQKVSHLNGEVLSVDGAHLLQRVPRELLGFGPQRHGGGCVLRYTPFAGGCCCCNKSIACLLRAQPTR